MDLAVAHPRVAGRRALEPVVVEGRGDFGVAGGAVGVAHEAAFLRLDVVAPAHGHVLGAVGDVSGAVLVVLGLVEGCEGAMVHPDAVAFLHRNGVCAVVGLGLAEIDVAYDDVGRADAEDADAVHHEAVGADDAEVPYIIRVNTVFIYRKSIISIDIFCDTKCILFNFFSYDSFKFSIIMLKE